MKAIYKKELRSYLTSMVGYIFIFFILLLTGIYFTAYNLYSSHPAFGATLGSIIFVFLITVPILTMRILAEERKQKTDQMLLTAPVSVGNIILGKYLALITVFCIPVGIMGCYPLIISMYGKVLLPMSYVALLGFFLLGCADIAIGVFLSSVTESQIIAAVLSFIVLFASYMISGISSFFSQTALGSVLAFGVLVLICTLIIYAMTKNAFVSAVIGLSGEIILAVLYITKASVFEGAIQKFLSIFNLSEHLNIFMDGMLDLTGIVYFISIVAISLYLAMQSVVKRRWS
jgi:ABC-2 type transport system permease protein